MPLSRNGPALRGVRLIRSQSRPLLLPLTTISKLKRFPVRATSFLRVPRTVPSVGPRRTLIKRLPPTIAVRRAPPHRKPYLGREETLQAVPLRCGGVDGPLFRTQRGWQPIVDDHAKRSFVSHRRGAFDKSTLQQWWDVLEKEITWDQPLVGKRRLPRSAAWLTLDRCSCTYNYGRTSWPALPMEKWFLDITDSVCKACGLTERPNCCNANFYKDGDQLVGWHADDEPLFAATQQDALIVSLSLGAPRTFELLANGEDNQNVSRVVLQNGDLCSMEGLMQKHYRHRVPPESHVQQPRINLTWRWIVDHDQSCPMCSGQPSGSSRLTSVVRPKSAPLAVKRMIISEQVQDKLEHEEKKRRRLLRFASSAPAPAKENVVKEAEVPAADTMPTKSGALTEKDQSELSEAEKRKRREERFGPTLEKKTGLTKPVEVPKILKVAGQQKQIVPVRAALGPIGAAPMMLKLSLQAPISATSARRHPAGMKDEESLVIKVKKTGEEPRKIQPERGQDMSRTSGPKGIVVNERAASKDESNVGGQPESKANQGTAKPLAEPTSLAALTDEEKKKLRAKRFASG